MIPFVVSSTVEAPAVPEGLRHTICDVDTDEIVHSLEPIMTEVLLSKPFPLIVKIEPPFMLPEIGLKALIAAEPVTETPDCNALPTPSN